MISVRVDRCPTCDGSGRVQKRRFNNGNPRMFPDDCSACTVVPGWQIPEWIKVPMVSYHTNTCSHGTARPKTPDCRCKGRIGPDFAYQPGVSVTLIGDCRECGGAGGELSETTPTTWTECACNDDPANPDDLDGAVTVAERVITELVPVTDGETFDLLDLEQYDGPMPIATFDPHDNLVVVTGLVVDGFAYESPDVDCVPGDLLAHLEEKP